ncbi:DUF2935 domain-containing protein [Paenibacillus sambharensis]|uniref:DUF2935 domain-containing protein n=1 Tax=Paenibacillus sambharensis TaxID=1803190 RepID=UPI0011B3FF78|nr:DUF2935 domain-containing protein [Paenibacillus sambharensis]
MPAKAPLPPWNEHLFWIGILEDHAVFVIDHLSARETRWMEAASGYRAPFAQLRTQLQTLDPALPVSDERMIAFARNAQSLAHSYYQFEGELQRRRIENTVDIQLMPVYFNGTLLENEEYLRILGYYVSGKPYPPMSLHALIDMWLEDQLGHAILLSDHIDPTELPLLQQTGTFIDAFQAHMAKNHAIGGFLRFTPPGFPAQRKFAVDVSVTSLAFYSFVEQTIERFRRDEVLGRLTLRFLEHHLPETCYFLYQLARFDPRIVPPENCYLWKPHVSE